MGDRISIRFVYHDETNHRTESSPVFYGHWCGLRALKEAVEVVQKGCHSPGLALLNTILRVMSQKHHTESYDLWDSEDKDTAGCDNGLWTYYIHTKTWVVNGGYGLTGTMHGTAHTNEEVLNYIKTVRPCLFRECECEYYGTEHCEKAFWDKINKNKKNKETEE